MTFDPQQPTVVPEGSVIITPAQVYTEVRLLTEQVRTLIARDTADAAERAETRARLDALEARVRSVEQKVWVASGAAAAVGSAAATFIIRVYGGA